MFTIEAECVACCEAIYKAIWLRNKIMRFKVVKNTSRILIICYNNVVVVNFSQMIKVLPIQNILILSINLLERRYTSIITIAMDYMLADPLTKGLDVKLFVNK